MVQMKQIRKVIAMGIEKREKEATFEHIYRLGVFTGRRRAS